MAAFDTGRDRSAMLTLSHVSEILRNGTGPGWLKFVMTENVRRACRVRGIQVCENRIPARYLSDVYFALLDATKNGWPA